MLMLLVVHTILLPLVSSVSDQNNLNMVQAFFILYLTPYRSHSFKASLEYFLILPCPRDRR